MISIHSGGVIGTAGVLATAALMGSLALSDYPVCVPQTPPAQPYLTASADSSRANTVWVAASASTMPSHADFQALAIQIAEQQIPLSAEFDKLLADRFEDLLD